MQRRYRDGERDSRPAAGSIDDGITVSGLTVTRYNELQQKEKQLNDLVKRIAACATIKTDAIDAKERKYRETSRKYTERELNEGVRPVDKEKEELGKLYDAWLDELESPRVTVDGNKVAKLILEYAACGMKEQEREHYGFCDGLPEGAKVKIE